MYVANAVVAKKLELKSSAKSSTISTTRLLHRYRLTPEQRQISSQVQWYVCSDMKISKRSFENPFFKAMLQVC